MKVMLAKIGEKEDLSKKNMIFEPKVDGTRAICFKDGKLKFINRRNRDISFRYPEFDFIGNIKAKTCVLDGEIIVYDKKGVPSFNLLQKRDQLGIKFMIELRSEQYPATYVVFDILRLDGKDLKNLTLIERKKILDKVVKDGNHIQKIFYTSDGKSLWKKITKLKLEGVMAKEKKSKYHEASRIASWLKIKYLKTIDCIIVGYTSKKRVISALAVGVYLKGKLIYIGRVGIGFTEKFLKELHKDLKKLEVKKAPVIYNGKEDIQWIKPQIVCEVRYLEFSKDNIMRAPAFLRLREDKTAKECKFEEQV